MILFTLPTIIFIIISIIFLIWYIKDDDNGDYFSSLRDPFIVLLYIIFIAIWGGVFWW